LNLHALCGIADADYLIAVSVEGDILVAIVVIVAVALGTADTFRRAIGDEKGAIGHDMIIAKEGNSPGNYFLDFNVHDLMI